MLTATPSQHGVISDEQLKDCKGWNRENHGYECLAANEVSRRVTHHWIQGLNDRLEQDLQGKEN